MRSLHPYLGVRNVGSDSAVSHDDGDSSSGDDDEHPGEELCVGEDRHSFHESRQERLSRSTIDHLKVLTARDACLHLFGDNTPILNRSGYQMEVRTMMVEAFNKRPSSLQEHWRPIMQKLAGKVQMVIISVQRRLALSDGKSKCKGGRD